MESNNTRIAAGVLFLWLFLCAAAIAQRAPGSIHGILTDSSGASIPSADISLAGNNLQKSTRTLADGSYDFSGLAAGDYKIAVTFPGFNAFSQIVNIDPGADARLPIQLTVTGGRQEITVTSDPDSVSVEPSHNASATIVKGKDLDALPDDPGDLNDMLQALAGPSAGPSGPSMVVDGFEGGQLPPKNTIREVRINQNPFSSEYGGLGFGRIEIITKPGTDTLHGQFQLTDSDSFFNSRNPYAANKAAYVNRAFNETLSNSFAKKGSWTLNATQNKVDNDAIIHAVTLDTSTLQETPVDQSVTTPRNNFAGTARIDYQLTPNQSVTARYTDNRTDSQNNGIGGYALTDRAYGGENSSHEFRLTETAVLSASAVTETRLVFSRNSVAQYGSTSTPSLVVAGSFSSGSAQVGQAYDNENDLDAQSTTTVVHGPHTVRFGAHWHYLDIVDGSPSNFGGTFTFFGVSNAPELNSDNQPIPGTSISITSLEQYRRTLLFEKLGYPAATIQMLGGGASQFSIASGNPVARLSQTQASAFVQDDWRILPNLTLSPGIRYEMQTDFHDPADIGPRLGLAWSPDGKGGKPSKTVIRVGAGMFYDRFGTNMFLQANRFNGVNQRQFLVTDPTFFAAIPSLATLAGQQEPPVTWKVAPDLKPLAEFTQAITLERQLPGNSPFSITFFHIRGNHVPLLINANTPLPGTYNPDDPASGIRPYGNAAGNIFEYDSEGIFNQKVMFMKWDSHIGSKVSLTANYTLRYANNNTGWMNSPAHPFDLTADYGRANYDRRNNFTLVGTIQAPFGLELAPMLVMNSGAPYDLTVGSDLNGDSFANDRPAFATDLSRPSVVFTRFGAFDTDPVPGQTLVPRDYLVGSGMWNLNARLGKTFGLGTRLAATSGSGDKQEKRFKLNFNIEVTNVFNHLNPGGYVGNLSSPLFGQPTSVYLFSDTSNLRRVQFGTSFNF